MASDVGLLAIAVIAVLLGAGAFAIMAISARRRRALTAAAREKRTRRELAALDDYIARLDQAESAADIDRLEEERDNPQCGNS